MPVKMEDYLMTFTSMFSFVEKADRSIFKYVVKYVCSRLSSELFDWNCDQKWGGGGEEALSLSFSGTHQTEQMCLESLRWKGGSESVMLCYKSWWECAQNLNAVWFCLSLRGLCRAVRNLPFRGCQAQSASPDFLFHLIWHWSDH